MIPRVPGLDVRSACEWVASVASDVRIDGAALAALAADLRDAQAPPAWGWPHLGTDAAPAEDVAAWTLLLSALNFCFWEDEPRWRVDGRDGYMALAQALRRAHDSGAPVCSPAAWASWPVGDLAVLLQGDPGGPAAPPMLAERHAVAAEMGAWLRDSFAGSALTALRAAPAPAGLRDRSGLTAFADYKLPQVLRAAGALEYSPSLSATIDARVELDPGCAVEVEIRACTVVAVDRLGALLRADPPLVDTMLWWRGQGLRAQPYHRVRT